MQCILIIPFTIISIYYLSINTLFLLRSLLAISIFWRWGLGFCFGFLFCFAGMNGQLSNVMATFHLPTI